MPKETTTRCPRCGNAYKSLANHWNKSSHCDYPELSTEQKTAIEYMAVDGVLRMEDGCVNASVRKTTANPDLAAWLSEKLDFMARESFSTEFHDTFGDENKITVGSRSHPWIGDELADEEPEEDQK